MGYGLKATGGTTAQNALSTNAEMVIAANQSRTSAWIKNADSSIVVYFGFVAGVSSSTGYKLAAGEEFELDGYIGAVYMVAASGTPTVCYAEW